MKAFRLLGRDIRDAFKSVFRNFSLSLASISCITITLIVVAIGIVVSINVENLTSKVEHDVTIVAFLDVDITDEQIEEVENQILALDNVDIDNVVYKDKMDITKDMMKSSEVWNSIMSEWTKEDSPLKSTFQVKVNELEKISDTANSIKEIDGVAVVKYGEGMIEQLVNTFDFVRKACMVAIVALIIVTAFLIVNTIKITIISRKREIEIMRLVGASNVNIKVPFIIEGLLLGALGSIIPIVLTTYGYTAVYERTGGYLFSQLITLTLPTPFIYYASLILLGIGVLVGMFGSARAVRKYLKI